MKTNKGGWCTKPWSQNMTASEYATIIITQARRLAIEGQQQKSEYEKSIEFLYQAIKGGHLVEVATAEQTKIQVWQDLNWNKELPEKYQVQRLVDVFLDLKG